MRLWVTAALAVCFAGGALGDEVGSAQAGLEFARENCVECHDVEREYEELAAFYGPAFVDIAAEPTVTEMSLKVFFRTPHVNMPNFILAEQDRDNVIAYILSLRGAYGE